MITIDTERIKSALKDKGYSSILELAQALGIHRNTIHYHLSGRPILPESVEKLIHALDLKPAEVIIEKKEPAPLLPEKVAALIDQLHTEFPDVTFVLFGSRARGKAHKYSDFDIGVYSRSRIPLQTFSSISGRTEDLADKTPYMVNATNLNQANDVFLREISLSWIFLAGSQQSWMELQKKVSQ